MSENCQKLDMIERHRYRKYNDSQTGNWKNTRLQSKTGKHNKIVKKKKKDIEKNKNRHRLGWGAENGGVKGIKEILTAK